MARQSMAWVLIICACASVLHGASAVTPNTFSGAHAEVVFSNTAFEVAIAPLTHEHKYYMAVSHLTADGVIPLRTPLAETRVHTTSTFWGGSRTTWTVDIATPSVNASMTCTLPGQGNSAVSCNATMTRPNTTGDVTVWVQMWSRQHDHARISRTADDDVVILMQREDASHSATLVVEDGPEGSQTDAGHGHATVSQQFRQSEACTVLFHLSVVAVTMDEIIANVVFFVVAFFPLLLVVVALNIVISRCNAYFMQKEEDAEHSGRNAVIVHMLA